MIAEKFRSFSRQPVRHPDANCAQPEAFRVCTFSVQADHLHLIVEAASQPALVEGMRGLAIRLARQVNRVLGRRGSLFADRWHGHELKSPREVRHALVYVIANFRKHIAQATARLDVFSSAPYFQGFEEYCGVAPCQLERCLVPRTLRPPTRSPVAEPRTWLLAIGWKRQGYVSIHEGPGRFCKRTAKGVAVCHAAAPRRDGGER